jgi:hypothetical protein
MVHAVIAEQTGTTMADADSLLSGRVHASVANRLGVPMGYIESFINAGSAAKEFADCLGVNMLAAEELGKSLGREGRIGLIFGLLFEK